MGLPCGCPGQMDLTSRKDSGVGGGMGKPAGLSEWQPDCRQEMGGAWRVLGIGPQEAQVWVPPHKQPHPLASFPHL